MTPPPSHATMHDSPASLAAPAPATAQPPQQDAACQTDLPPSTAAAASASTADKAPPIPASGLLAKTWPHDTAAYSPASTPMQPAQPPQDSCSPRNSSDHSLPDLSSEPTCNMSSEKTFRQPSCASEGSTAPAASASPSPQPTPVHFSQVRPEALNVHQSRPR